MANKYDKILGEYREEDSVDLSGYALLDGTNQPFTGNISALNLSGTNTGDQDLSGYIPYTIPANTEQDLFQYRPATLNSINGTGTIKVLLDDVSTTGNKYFSGVIKGHNYSPNRDEFTITFGGLWYNSGGGVNFVTAEPSFVSVEGNATFGSVRLGYDDLNRPCILIGDTSSVWHSNSRITLEQLYSSYSTLADYEYIRDNAPVQTVTKITSETSYTIRETKATAAVNTFTETSYPVKRWGGASPVEYRYTVGTPINLHSGANSTGTVAIKLPAFVNTVYNVVKITGFDYTSTTGGWEVTVSGLNTGTSWVNPTVNVSGKPPFTSVRLAYVGADACILLGTTTTTWTRMLISVDLHHKVGSSTDPIYSDATDYTITTAITSEASYSIKSTYDCAFNAPKFYSGLGTAALPSITTPTDTDTGVYFSGANDLLFATAGVARMSFNSVGTASFIPNGTNTLNVSSTGVGIGGLVSGYSGQFNVQNISSAATTKVTAIIKQQTSQTGALTQWQNNVGTVGAEMTVGFNLGLGITPAERLHIYQAAANSFGLIEAGGAGYAAQFRFKTTVREFRIGYAPSISAFNIYDQTAAATRFAINNAGSACLGATTPLDAILLRVYRPATQITTANTGVYVDGVHTLSADNAYQWRGVYSGPAVNQATFNATASTSSGGSVPAFYALPQATGASGTITNVTGYFSSTRNTGAGIVSQMMGFSAGASLNSGGGTITNNYSFYSADQTVGTNNYGFYSTLTAATGKWAFYSAGDANNYFAGNVGVGVAPLVKLHSQATTEQLRLGYDASNYTSFTGDSSGNLGIVATGGNIGINQNTANSSLDILRNNDDYTNTSGTGSHITMRNDSGSQNVITSYIGSTLVAKWRTDNVGNVTWVSGATASDRGHYFFIEGDYGVGHARMKVSPGGTAFGYEVTGVAPSYPVEVYNDDGSVLQASISNAGEMDVLTGYKVGGVAGYTGDLNDSTSTKIADVVGGIITGVYY